MAHLTSTRARRLSHRLPALSLHTSCNKYLSKFQHHHHNTFLPNQILQLQHPEEDIIKINRMEAHKRRRAKEHPVNLLLLVISVTLFLFYITEVESNGHKQKYGENCSRNKKCDFTKWLRCKDGKCTCFQNAKDGKRPELYYDPNQERCVGLSGTNCSQKFYPFDDEDAYYFHMRGSTTNHWRYGNGSLRCGANAFCDLDAKAYTCNCKRNYYEADDGKCYKLKSYGDPCTIHKECDPDGYLNCGADNTCACEKDNHLYEASLNKCVVLAGLPCEIRFNRLDRRQVDDCTVDSFCEEDTSVCRCQFGTQIHSDRTCQRGFGQECDHDHPCGDSKLSCRSKYCQCKYPFHMKYDEPTGQCVGIASGPCIFKDTSELAIQCTANAECVQRGIFSECKCKSGFLQTGEGDCVKVHGSDCEVDADCDRVGPLACINAHCQCEDLLLNYDNKTRKCKGVVGSRCKMDEDSCVDHATCNKFEEVATKSNVGRCLCNGGYKETVDRTCSNSY